MFTILKNCCCVYFCPWLYDETNSDSDISDDTTIDTHIPYYRFNDQAVSFQNNPLYYSEKMTRN